MLGRDGGIGFFLALYVIISCSPLKQVGLDISALLIRCIMSGTGSTGDCSCHEWTTTLLGCSGNITIVDYDLNMSFHCTGCRRSLLIWTYFDTTVDFLKRSNSSYEQHMLHVFDRLLFIEVHPERDLEWGMVFLDGACDDMSN